MENERELEEILSGQHQLAAVYYSLLSLRQSLISFDQSLILMGREAYGEVGTLMELSKRMEKELVILASKHDSGTGDESVVSTMSCQVEDATHQFAKDEAQRRAKS